MQTDKNNPPNDEFVTTDPELRELFLLLFVARDARTDGDQCDALKQLSFKAEALWKKCLDQS